MLWGGTVVEQNRSRGRFDRPADCEAVRQGADALVVACQLCQSNLDMRQAEISREGKAIYALPVIYFTQLMGLAFGLPARTLGLNHHLVNPPAHVKGKRIGVMDKKVGVYICQCGTNIAGKVDVEKIAAKIAG